MYAIIDVAGQQFKVKKNDQIITPRLDGEIGSQVDIDRVLLLSSDDEVKVGAPYLEGAKVLATIVEHDKADKVIIFKKKRRKGYKVKKGRRQPQTRLKIEDIVV